MLSWLAGWAPRSASGARETNTYTTTCAGIVGKRSPMKRNSGPHGDVWAQEIHRFASPTRFGEGMASVRGGTGFLDSPRTKLPYLATRALDLCEDDQEDVPAGILSCRTEETGMGIWRLTRKLGVFPLGRAIRRSIITLVFDPIPRIRSNHRHHSIYSGEVWMYSMQPYQYMRGRLGRTGREGVMEGDGRGPPRTGAQPARYLHPCPPAAS